MYPFTFLENYLNYFTFMIGLQDTTLALDFRVTILENGGSGGNSSIAELEVRVEHLKEQLPIKRLGF